ncbi:MAG: hypothetical protein IRZ09_07070 [Variibacter sp.]|nr:hypothetical protein [Variibacter sp.]
MRKFLFAVLFTSGLAVMPTDASATLLSGPAALMDHAGPQDAGVQPVHWRRYWHCHRRAWRTVCHGPRRPGWHRRWESRRGWHRRW